MPRARSPLEGLDTVGTMARGVHACLLYEPPDDPVDVAAPFIAHGLREGERCVYLVGDRDAAAIREAIARRGVDVEREESRGALAFLHQWDVSFPSGAFDSRAMLEFVREAIAGTTSRGFRGLRVAADMTWALRMGIDEHDVVQWEAIANDLYEDRSLVALCMYDRRRFSADVCRGAIRAHPVVAVGERLYPNGYYELPDAFGSGATERVDGMLEQLRRVRAAEDEHAEQLRSDAARRARDEFVTIAAHELRTPLAALTASVDLVLKRLESGTLDRRTLQDLMRRVRRQADRQVRMIDELLDGARLANGTLTIEKEPVDLAALVRGVVERFHSALLVSIDAPDPVQASVDPARIEQVMNHLLESARRHCAAGTRVKVVVHGDEASVRVEVRDRGPGVDEEHRAHLFDRYYRADGRTAEGMGLGLHVSRAIARLHGGDLSAEFPPEGGTTFVLVLPRR